MILPNSAEPRVINKAQAFGSVAAICRIVQCVESIFAHQLAAARQTTAAQTVRKPNGDVAAPYGHFFPPRRASYFGIACCVLHGSACPLDSGAPLSWCRADRPVLARAREGESHGSSYPALLFPELALPRLRVAVNVALPLD